jgi:hypothetical protein
MTSNNERAHLGRVAIEAFTAEIEEKGDLEDAVTDLIADVLHYAKEKRLDPSRVAQHALRVWRAEDRDPDGDGARARLRKTAFKRALWYGLAFVGAGSYVLLLVDEAIEQLAAFGYLPP